ncbi:MAG TPA: hypothetical protein VFK20_17005 [Vicinamibacterales bacterium]|nr:hypothetical protein [Vicinamibacterales bacterium]
MTSMRRRAASFLPMLAGALMFAWPAVPAAAQQSGKPDKKQQQRLEQAQRQDLQALMQLADQAMRSEPVPTDIPLQFHNDFLKAQENRTYVPFILTFDPAALSTRSVSLYVRVAPRGATAPAAASDKDGKKDKDKQPPAPAYPFEDVHHIDVEAPAPGQPAHVSRAFAVPAGDYDVYLVMRERNVANGAAPRATVLKEAITVPNFWSTDLTTSSVILADRVDALSAPLSRDQQVDHPYALGQSDIKVAADAKFAKNEELSVVFLIYNPAFASDGKFDLQADYAFYRKTSDGEQYFNRTEPQRFNKEVLGPQFDLAAGHQLVAGQAVPLAGFPEGDYRLEIKVTDLVSGKTLTRNVNFTVTS